MSCLLVVIGSVYVWCGIHIKEVFIASLVQNITYANAVVVLWRLKELGMQ